MLLCFQQWRTEGLNTSWYDERIWQCWLTLVPVAGGVLRRKLCDVLEVPATAVSLEWKRHICAVSRIQYLYWMNKIDPGLFSFYRRNLETMQIPQDFRIKADAHSRSERHSFTESCQLKAAETRRLPNFPQLSYVSHAQLLLNAPFVHRPWAEKEILGTAVITASL